MALHVVPPKGKASFILNESLVILKAFHIFIVIVDCKDEWFESTF